MARLLTGAEIVVPIVSVVPVQLELVVVPVRSWHVAIRVPRTRFIVQIHLYHRRPFAKSSVLSSSNWIFSRESSSPELNKQFRYLGQTATPPWRGQFISQD